MKIGIIGQAGSGKTTLFNALTGQTMLTGGSSRKTHLGVVHVPDPRLETVRKLAGRRDVVNAEITFSDVAGGFAKPTREHGLDAELANMMKAMDAFAIVVADFPEYSSQSGGKTTPKGDASEMESDLMLADLVQVESRLERMQKETAPQMEKDAVQKCKDWLDAERPLRLLELNPTEAQILEKYAFLSVKPALFILNIAEDNIGNPPPADVVQYSGEHGVQLIAASAKVEMEIAQMEPAERTEFLKAVGLEESALNRFVRASYSACSLISFFTAAPGGTKTDEARAWTIRKGSTAFEAAGKIHTDIQRGFIRAEVVGYEEFVQAGGFEALKSLGKLRLEGKEYIVQDGDIISFRFNV